jgi:hypothetical protein
MFTRLGIGLLGVALIAVGLWFFGWVARGRALKGSRGPIIVGHFPTMAIIAGLGPIAIPVTLVLIGAFALYDAVTGGGIVKDLRNDSELASFYDPAPDDVGLIQYFQHGNLDPRTMAGVVSARPGAVVRSCPKASCLPLYEFSSEGAHLLVIDDKNESGRPINPGEAEQDGWVRVRTGMGKLWILKAETVAFGDKSATTPISNKAPDAHPDSVLLKAGAPTYACPRTNCASMGNVPEWSSSQRRMTVADADVKRAPEWLQIFGNGHLFFVQRSATEMTHPVTIKVGGAKYSAPNDQATLIDRFKEADERQFDIPDSDFNLPDAPGWIRLPTGAPVKKSDLE